MAAVPFSSSLRIIDGGFGSTAAERTQLQVNGHVLWSARLLIDDPQLVQSIHEDFLRAGADILETNSYQASVQQFMKAFSLSQADAVAAIAKSVHLAREAVRNVWSQISEGGTNNRLQPLVAACIGPFGAHLADASEYSGSYLSSVTRKELIDWHRCQVSALWYAEPDFLAFDSIPGVEEALAIQELLETEFSDVRAWLSFSSRDGRHTCRGEDLFVAASELAHSAQLFAIGINCLAPQQVSMALTELRRGLQAADALNKKILIAYPNSGETYNQSAGWKGDRWEGCELAALSTEWVNLGARWIGGCCRVGPDQLRYLADNLHNLRLTRLD